MEITLWVLVMFYCFNALGNIPYLFLNAVVKWVAFLFDSHVF